MSSEPVTGISAGLVIADSYQLTEVIGRGGMGAVWAARHLRLPGKRVAIKVLLGVGADANALARFRREAEITSRIGHPNIVEVLDFNLLADGTPYQVLEFLDGESLGQRLRAGPIPIAEALELVLQIGSALRAAHRSGVVHRDLKPDNIFLCPSDSGGVVNDRVKILDFGISKIRGSQTLQTQESVLIGTPQYMSPEQAAGKNQELDQRTDIFALGAIVYEMLAGQPAFSGASVVAVVMDVVQGIPTPLSRLVPGLPPEVEAAVARALAKRPEQRFQDVGEMVAALTGRTLQTLRPEGRRTSSVSPSASTLALDDVPTARSGPAVTMRLPATADTSPQTPAGMTVAPDASPAPPSPTTRRVTPARAGAVHPSRRGRWLLGVVGGAVILLGAAWGIRVFGPPSVSRSPPFAEQKGRPQQETARPQNVSTTATKPDPKLEPKPPAEAGPQASAGDADTGPPPRRSGDAEPHQAGGAAAGDGHDHARRRHPPSAEEIPPAAAEPLEEAERLLAAGDAGEAIRRARQSFFVKKTNRGWGLLVRAFCVKGDLENAKASFRNLPAGSGERAQALRACKAKQIDLR
jgi:serine/threonine-protein kinase